MDEDIVCRGPVRREGAGEEPGYTFWQDTAELSVLCAPQRIVLVEHRLTGEQVRPFLSDNFLELLQGSNDIIHNHSGPWNMWFV